MSESKTLAKRKQTWANLMRKKNHVPLNQPIDATDCGMGYCVARHQQHRPPCVKEPKTFDYMLNRGLPDQYEEESGHFSYKRE